jgi:hypothetical protein
MAVSLKSFKESSNYLKKVLKSYGRGSLLYVGKTNERATTIAFQASEDEKAELKKLGNVSELVRRSYLERLHETHPDTANRIEEIRREYESGIDINRKTGAAKRVGNIRRAHAANRIDSPEGVSGAIGAALKRGVGSAEQNAEARRRASQKPEQGKGDRGQKGEESA